MQNQAETDSLYKKSVDALIASEFESACAMLEIYVTRVPNSSQGFLNLGIGYLKLNRIRESKNCFLRALSLEPRYPEALNNLGYVYIASGETSSAISCLKKALRIRPNYGSALHNLAAAYARTKSFNLALMFINQAIALSPKNAELYNTRGLLYQEMHQLDSAKSDLSTAIELNPSYGEALNNLGLVYAELGKLYFALAYFDQSLLIYPNYREACFNKSLVLLSVGDYIDGLKLFEFRGECLQTGIKFKYKNSLNMIERNRVIGKEILITHEQGLGDAIQMFRYVKHLVDLGASVKLEVPSTLHAIFIRACPRLEVLEPTDKHKNFDFHCSLMSLPLAFFNYLTAPLLNTRYLYADIKKKEDWRNLISKSATPKIGICWSSTSKYKLDYKRSMKFPEFLDLFVGLNCDLYILQKSLTHEELKLVNSLSNIYFFGDDLASFDDTAALASCMDCVVSTCTSIPHLSAALGIPTFLLLSAAPDWRWGKTNSVSPIYESIAIFRQSKLGEWSEPIRSLNRRLRECFSNNTEGT